MRAKHAIVLIPAITLLAGCDQLTLPTSATPLSVNAAGAQASATTALNASAAVTSVPVKGRLQGAYEGSGDPPIVTVQVDASGNAALLGRFTFYSVHQVSFIDLTGVGTAVLTAANGDEVFTDLAGQAEPREEGVFFITETLTITGGTGRFAGASGQLIVERLSVPNGMSTGTTDGTLTGTITMPRGSH